ncbi:SGNH/GDSL hydrolase family protein [Enterococcus casseliflavus]|uniref:SGNH/GDSL hydrolase family protein n=1 Tax=Enterococcus casseliflavus TaxID=37734 RepID=UPI003D0F716C
MELDQFRDVDLVIDYANYTFIEKQFVSQGDYKGRTLTVLVTNKGVVGEVPGLMLNLNWHNEASGMTDLSAFSVLDKANSIYRIEYPQHMMTPGRVIASIQVIQNGKVTNLKQFELTVQRLAGQAVGIIEKAEFSALVAVLADTNKFRSDIDDLSLNKADKTQIYDIKDEISKMPSATPRASFKSFTALNEAYPIGSEYPMIVTDSAGENGFIYLWTGSVWEKGPAYVANVASERSIRPNHTVFLQATDSKNLFDKYSNGISVGSFINDKGSWSNNALYSYSDKINATAGDVFRICTATEVQSVHGGAFDSSGNWLANIPRANSQWTVPDIAGLSYVRFVYLTSTIDDLMIVKNEPAAPTIYYPFKYELGDGIEIDEQNVKNLDKKVWAKENVEFIVYDQTENLFNKSDPGVTIGRILDPNNNWSTATGYSQSHYFEVAPGDVIKKSTDGYGHAFDADFNHVAYIPWSNSRLTVPNDDSIKYVSCSFLTENIDTLMIVRNQELPSVYVPFKISKLSEDITVDEKQIVRSDVPKMKVYGIGDSISTTSYASNPYWKLINERSAKLAITVDAKSGSRIVKADDRTDSLAERYTAVGSGYDMVYIFMGTNDAQGSVPIGEIGSTDVTTIKGSLNVAITHWMNTYPKMKIAIITPIQRNGNLAGRLRTYTDAIIEIAEKYGIPYFDGLKNSMYLTNVEVRTTLSTDGLHPNNDGHAYIANRFESFLSSI